MLSQQIIDVYPKKIAEERKKCTQKKKKKKSKKKKRKSRLAKIAELEDPEHTPPPTSTPKLQLFIEELLRRKTERLLEQSSTKDIKKEPQ